MTVIGIGDRRAHAQQQRVFALAAVLLGMAAMVYFLTSFYLRFVIDFKHASKLMGETAKGNLWAHVRGRGSDELADLATQREGRAATLAQAVSSFQLQQGAAEEAMQLVERAMSLRAHSGREAFAQQITEPRRSPSTTPAWMRSRWTAAALTEPLVANWKR